MPDNDARKTEYKNGIRRKFIFIIVTAAAALVCMIVTLGAGVYDISLTDAVSVWWDHMTGNIVNEKDDHYIWDIRFSRALMALFVGAALAAGGAVMQSVLKNPLADPYTMGVSSGAFFGAVLSIICGISLIPIFTGNTATIANAFLLSFVPIAVIIIISKYKRVTPTVMILAGIAVMYLFSSFTQYLMVTADSSSLAEAYSWRVGTLSDTTWETLPFVVIPTLILSSLLIILAKRINVLSMDEAYSQTLGVNIPKSRILLLSIVALQTSVVVSFTGTIGFIGLVCPHIVRIFVGSDNRYLLPASVAFGAAFLIAIDTVAKISGANGLPVGVISALIGGPVFVYLLIKQKKNMWMQ